MLRVFNFLTLNGFFKGPNDDISWHGHGGDESSMPPINYRAKAFFYLVVAPMNRWLPGGPVKRLSRQCPM